MTTWTTSERGREMVTILDNVTLTAGQAVDSPPIPISANAIGVVITIDCDTTVHNSFRLEYVDSSDVAHLIGTPSTPVTGSLWCRYEAQQHMAGQTVKVRVTADQSSTITVSGDPITG